jgi:hypothetical protein
MKNVIISSIISAIFSVSAVFAATATDAVKKPVVQATEAAANTEVPDQEEAKEGTEEAKK